jgi:[ribosomal protein S18]-alanine N-acetyltransferase
LTTRTPAPDWMLAGYDALKYLLEPMQLVHVPAVSAIERESFPSVWPPSAYRREIERNQMAHYVVAKRSPLAGEPRRGRRFPVTGLDADESNGLLDRLARMIRGQARHFSSEEAEELEAVVGYSGMWIMVDEAHITTIAVDPAYRSEGIGELLLLALLERAQDLGAAEATLECRMSNDVAQRLYRKYTFRDAGVRKRYYSDDGEDALIMTSEPLVSPIFQQVLARNRIVLFDRLRAPHPPLAPEGRG